MENHSQIEELKKIADSKRVPNAIMLYGSNDEKLKAALDFSKMILGLNLDSEKKQISEMMCDKLNQDRKSTRLNSSHSQQSRMPSSA